MIRTFFVSLIISVVVSSVICAVTFKPIYKVYGDTRHLGYRYGSHVLPEEEEQKMERSILLKHLVLTHFLSSFFACFTFGAFKFRLANQSLNRTLPCRPSAVKPGNAG